MNRAALLLMAPVLIAATPPQPKQVILDSEAYPEAARNAGVEGDIAFDLAIDAKGVVTGCTVTKGADLPAGLAADACALARANWKFLPARDAAGKKCRAACIMPSPSAFPGAAHRPMGRRSACFSRPPGDRPAPWRRR